MCCAVVSHSVVFDSATPWAVAFQAPLSMGILQERILEWVAIYSSRDLANPGTEPRSPIAGLFVYLHNNYFFVDNWGE